MNPVTQPPRTGSQPGVLDVIIVGAGFAGVAMLRKLRDLNFSVAVLEAGSGAGGTWFWNRYPGARCDVESMQYSYQFSEALQQEWQWAERYAAQAEILAYINHVIERFELAQHIRFNARVTSASFDTRQRLWMITTEGGSTHRARFCILATGPLSSANVPAIPGLDRFRGETYHTGRWPHQRVSFTGKRVAVIGTGSSGVQAIPIIAEEAQHLYVLQRTAAYVAPARNRLLDLQEQQQVKSKYAELRAYWRSLPSATGMVFGEKSAALVNDEERSQIFEAAWARGGLGFQRSFIDLTTNEVSNKAATDFFRRKIAEVVKDPRVADLLTPRQMYGTKRLCLGTNYYETFNRPNVMLVNLRATPLIEITAAAIHTSDRAYEVDVIVFATGFDALTGSFLRIDVTGEDDLTLRKAWEPGPQTYLGVSTKGFPNLFFMAGPGSPSVLANVVTAIEQQADWLADCLSYLRERGAATIEARRDAQEKWTARVSELASQTLLVRGDSWYVGANIPGKPRVFMPYLLFPRYAATCAAVAQARYEGFDLQPAHAASRPAAG